MEIASTWMTDYSESITDLFSHFKETEENGQSNLGFPINIFCILP